MTLHTLKIAALSTPLLHWNRERSYLLAAPDAGRSLVKKLPSRALGLAFLVLALAVCARANTYYIDWMAGSNSNVGTSKAAAWKSAPGMQTGAGCGGATNSGYAHAAGDQFIFKGGTGETWPAACFGMTISSGGTSAAQDYYGVDKTWFAGGSWTRPLFDLAQAVPTGRHVISVTSTFPGYTTFDNFEIANQGLVLGTFALDDAYNFSARSSAMPGVLITNNYIHDWVSNTNVGAFTSSQQIPYSSGSIYDGVNRITVDHTTIEDSGGFFFAGATKIFGGFGGACVNCGTLQYSVIHDGFAGAFTVSVTHDNEFYNITQRMANYCGDPTGSGGGACRPHSQVIEDDFQNDTTGETVYNNLVHDNAGVGLGIAQPYRSRVFNNVVWNTSQSLVARTYPNGDSASAVGVWENNVVDCSGGGNCIAGDPSSSNPNGLGTLFLRNNIFITNAGNGGVCFGGPCATFATITTLGAGGKNYSMPTAEAAAFGFTSPNKYKPTSPDSNTAGQGINLTSTCTGNLLQLCQDTSGAPWFGGSAITRPTGSTAWDLGAYQSQGGATGPPTVSFTSPSPGTVSGTQTLTVTATPQGSATISSCQFTIDGFPFGAPDTSAPYTTSWNTATAANANHILGATCTDSNAQVGTAGTVAVTVLNSMPGCFISTDSDSGALSWTANQAFTAQTANFTATFTATPNTNNQDSVIALSQAPMSAYSQGAALVRFNSSGQIDVYKGSLGNYTADATVNYTAGVTYAFTFTVDMTAGAYTVALTSPTSVTLATGYSFRTTASAASLGYINAISDNTTPDTAQVCNFQIGSVTSLTFSPLSLNFGNITVGGNATQTITATTSGGSVNFSSAAISGNADFTINSNTCTGPVPSSCTTQIKFAPTSAALETATITFTDDATGSPQSVAVSGTGVPATPTLSVSPTSVNFGGVHVFTTSSSGPIILTISSGPVTFTGTPSFSGPNAADFALASNTCTATVSAASCQSVVSFTPSLVAAESATLTYTDNATGSPQTVALTGSGYLAPHPPTAVQATVQ